MRDVADFLSVSRDVVAHLAVASGKSPDELALFIYEADGRAVEFKLAAVCKGLTLENLLCTRHELGDFLARVGV